MQTVFITGATSGIGMEFAQAYAAQGCRLILVGRREDRLEKLRAETGTDCRLIRADLAEEEQCRKLLEEISDEPVDIFINNAGFGTAGSFLETDIDKETAMIRVNDAAMHILFKGVLQKMQAHCAPARSTRSLTSMRMWSLLLRASLQSGASRNVCLP